MSNHSFEPRAGRVKTQTRSGHGYIVFSWRSPLAEIVVDSRGVTSGM